MSLLSPVPLLTSPTPPTAVAHLPARAAAAPRSHETRSQRLNSWPGCTGPSAEVSSTPDRQPSEASRAAEGEIATSAAEPGRPAQHAAAQPQPSTAAAAQQEDSAPELNGPSQSEGGAGLVPKPPMEDAASEAEPQPAAAHGDTVGDGVAVSSKAHVSEGSNVQLPASVAAGEAASRLAAQVPTTVAPITDTAQSAEPAAEDVAQTPEETAADGALGIVPHDQVSEQRSDDGGDVHAEALTSAVAEALALAQDDSHDADGADAPVADLRTPQRSAAPAGLPNGDVTADANEDSEPTAEPAADTAEQPLPADGAGAAADREPAAPDAAETAEEASSPAKPPLPRPDSDKALQQQQDQQSAAANGPRPDEGPGSKDKLHMVGSIPDMSAAWKAKVAVSDATQVRWVRLRVRFKVRVRVRDEARVLMAILFSAAVAIIRYCASTHELLACTNGKVASELMLT